MRVYGSSPLYNYVELIFRSKRLFIACLVITTGVTVALAGARAGNYSAKALVYLTGTDTTQERGVNEAQRGSIQYKMNLLSVLRQDPKFIRDALTERGLNRGMSDEEFDKFCKKAGKALTFGFGNNVMEINCQWENPKVSDIILGFYSAFSRRVLDEETAASHISTVALKTRLAEYTTKQKDIEAKVAQYKKEHLDTPLIEFPQLQANLERQKQVVEQTEAALNTAKLQRDEVTRQLNDTPNMVKDAILHGAGREDPTIARLKDEAAVYEAKIADALANYTESNPKVKKLRETKDNIEKEIAIREKVKAGKAGSKNPGDQEREIQNPAFVQLQSQQSALDIQVQGLEGALTDAKQKETQLHVEASKNPDRVREYEWMTKDGVLYTSIRDNLRARLEQATMQENQERDMHLSEMKMIVEPEAELDMVGAKNAIFFAAGPLLGLIIAFAFSLLAESLDDSLRTPLEVEKFLGKPVLAVLPRMDSPKDSSRRRLGKGGGETIRPTLPS